MSTYLRLIHDDGGRDIYVIVHGLSTSGGYDSDALERQVHYAELKGSVYIFEWPASIVSLETILKLDLRKIDAAAEAGKSLARALARLHNSKSRPITLIGHSQGTLVIHCALEWFADRSRHVTRVLLMGGVVPSESTIWEYMARAVRQEIVNIHSAYDEWVSWLPNCIGCKPIESRFNKIRDFEVALRHSDYWENLPDVLESVWPNRRRSRKYHPTLETLCPWCETEFCTIANVPVVHEEGCGIKATYRPLDDSFETRITPKKIRCRCCDSGTIWVQESAWYGCDGYDCDGMNIVQRKGNRVLFRGLS